MSRRWLRFAVAAACGSAAVMSSARAGAAEPATLDCGTVIVESVTLADDLAGCPDNGLVVGADNVTLDLGGHSITGTGTGSGIVVAGSNFQVSNGSIRGFAFGVRMGSDYKHPLNGGEVSRLEVSGNSQGIYATYVTGTRFENNTLARNDRWGMGSYEAHGVVFVDNTLVGNGAGGLVIQDTGGVFSRNRVLHNGGRGMWLSDPYAVDLSWNRVDDNAGDGIVMGEDYGYVGVVITGNSANRNADHGIMVFPSGWPSPRDLPTDGGGNSAWRNGNANQCLNVDCARNGGLAGLPDEEF
jgi:hypothetical protein